MMTTMEKVPVRIPFDAVFSRPKPPGGRKRRWLRVVWVGGIGVGILLWLLPSLVAHSFLLNWIVGYLAADFQGQIRVGGATLGWFSPLVLRQIEVQESSGRPLASIDQLTSNRSLWKLLWNQQDLGQWLLEGAKLHVRVRPDGTNWEDALAGYFTASESAARAVQLELRAKDTVIFLTDCRSSRSWRLENLQGSLIFPPAPTQPWQLACTGQVLPADAEPTGSQSQSSRGSTSQPQEASQPTAPPPVDPGQFQFELSWGGTPPEAEGNADGQPLGGGFFLLQGQRVPLGLAEAILMRWEPLLHLEGLGSGWFVYGWGGWTGHVATGRSVPASNFTKPTDVYNNSTSASSAASASTGSPIASANAQPTIPVEPVGSALPGSGNPRPAIDLPPDSVVMQADISSDEAWISWERFVPERLQLKPMKLQGRIIWTNDYLQWEDFRLECQAGQLALSGRTPLSSHPAAWLDSLGQHPCQVSGRLDLPQLVRLLPQTLPIQAETQVTSGQVEFGVTTKPSVESTTWQAHLTTSQLKAIHQGQAIEWPEPLRFQLAAQQTPKGLLLETFQSVSEFLRIDAFGAEAGLSISAQMDLDRLSRRLSPWVNLGDVQLGGQANFSLTWTKKPQDSFELDLMWQADRLHVVIPTWSLEIADDIRARALVTGKISSTPPSTEQKAGGETISAGSAEQKAAREGISDAASQSASRGSLSGSTVSLPVGPNLPHPKLSLYSLSRIDSAVVAFQWGHDQGEIRLRQAVSAPTLKSRWPVEVRLQGQLADWVRRLKPWIDLHVWQPSGAYGLTASLDLGPESLQVHEARMAAAPFYLNAFGLQIAEPRVDLSFTGQWDWANHQLQLTQAHFQANPLVLQAQKLQVHWSSPAGGSHTNQPPAGAKPAAGSKPAPSLRLAGRLQAEGTLDHLQRWFAPTSTNTWRLAGAFTAQAEWQTDPSATSGLAQITIRQFSYTAFPGSRPWQQPEIQLAAQGRYDHQSGLLELTSCNLQGDGIGYVGTAQVSLGPPSVGANQAAIYRTSGQVQYDWYRLSPLVRSYLGSGILLQGRGAEQFRWQGPLDLALAEASLGIGWQQIDAYGFRGGPAVLRGQLSRGMLQIAPVEMDLCEGKLRAAGAVRLAPGPMELVVEKGSAARQIRISQQMCASALQYIAPVLADVTSVEGRASLLLDVCRVPLANPAASQIQGQLVIHNIQIGPGPLVHELATLLLKEPTARLRNEAVIPFTMANGRIYHEGLELIFPEITIRTQGYVGLDQSLALTAEMPILPKWTAMNPRLATAMKGQTIRLPIQGTLRRPQLDQVTLRRYAAQFLQKSAENLLQEELQRQLERLKIPGR